MYQLNIQEDYEHSIDSFYKRYAILVTLVLDLLKHAAFHNLSYNLYIEFIFSLSP